MEFHSLAVGWVMVGTLYGMVGTSFALYAPQTFCKFQKKKFSASDCASRIKNPFMPGLLMWWMTAKHCLICHFLLAPYCIYMNTSGRSDVYLLRMVCLGLVVNLVPEPVTMAQALRNGEMDELPGGPWFNKLLAMLALLGLACSLVA